MHGSDAPQETDALPAGTIRLDKLQLDYPIYQNLVFDRLREVAGSAFPSLRPPIKRVLDGISLTVEPGEMLGLLGRNGAGKTTLLKVVSGMIAPSSGKIAVNGRVMALLAMGTGFKGSFTGRENLYYGGLLLGLGRREMERLIDEIAAFAGLGSALDQPYFTYSSGMRARLGFALATSVPADIVILDESLATGDSRFVARCYNRIQEIRNSGRTILFVSHNLGEVARMTERVVVLDQGRIVFDGPSSKGITRYEEITLDPRMHSTRKELSGVRIQLDLLGMDGRVLPAAVIGAPVQLRLCLVSDRNLGTRFVQLRMTDARDNQLVTYLMKDRLLTQQANFEIADYNLRIDSGETEIVWHIPNWVPGEGQYLFDVYIGPPVETMNPDISAGRVWHKALVANAVYENPFLKGAAARLELPVNEIEIRRGRVAEHAE